jgi:hypothetical protein
MPAGADGDRHLRLKVHLVILAFAAAGIVLLWLGLGTLLSLIGALSREDAVIALSPRSLLPLPLSIAFLALAVLPFTRRDPPAKRRRPRGAAAKKGIEPSSIVFGVAVVAVLATIVIPPVSRLVVAAIVTDRGYQTCPPPKEWDRYAPYRWARSIKACP